MLKPDQKNNYQEFLKKKHRFDKKVKQGRKFKDTDHDGLSDYEEKNIYGTDPNNPDTDGDGMKDGQEVGRGRNPLGPGSLKDLFIPHAGNNYSPQALKPKRLLFHAISIVLMKLIVVIFILFYPLSAWLSPDQALAETKKIIELTNNLRQSVSRPALTENRQLSQAAWQKVEDMALNQYFAHISPAGLGLRNWLEKIGYKYAMAGENLAVGFSSAEDVVAAWKNSPTHYDNLVDSDFKEIGVAMADGKLNQVDTAFIAQYFAAPSLLDKPAGSATAEAQIKPEAPSQTKPQVKDIVKKQEITKAPSPVIKPVKPETANLARKTALQGKELGVKEMSASTAPTTAVQKENEIIIDQPAATLTIKSDQFNQEKVIQIKTPLPADTVSAEIIINGRQINLIKTPNQDNEWSGAALIDQTEEKNILNPLIPASITVKNATGAIYYGKIDWDGIEIIKATPLEHYQLFKANPAAAMKPIMNLSSSYFELILIISIIAMLLNIFIEIKKQRPRIIFYSIAFLALLSAMIIF